MESHDTVLEEKLYVILYRQKLEWHCLSAPWALGFLAVEYICVVIALRGPQCGLLYSALKSTLVMCDLAVGRYPTPPDRRTLWPVALTPKRQAEAGSLALHSPAGSDSAFPPGLHWASISQRALCNHDGSPLTRTGGRTRVRSI